MAGSQCRIPWNRPNAGPRLKVLLTGASSFTGYWFARELAAAGHYVLAPLRAESKANYSGIRRERVNRLTDVAEIRWGVSFGDPQFVALLTDGADILCHHAARVEDYKSADFDVVRALHENTYNVREVVEVAKVNGLTGMLLTGSVFEQDEGAGELPLRACSPYGLSKGLSFQVARYWAETLGLPIAKFVIPNPFGPYEEPRFCDYLLKRWMQNLTASVRTPRYLRDNIHVTLLAKAYVSAVERLANSSAFFRCAPSGYTESQGEFALRFSAEIGRRLGLKCEVVLEEQSDFSEPLVRLNTEPADAARYGWNEVEAWDQLAEYYRRTYPNAQSDLDSRGTRNGEMQA
jgi:UDP-glucose 4-epimerase